MRKLFLSILAFGIITILFTGCSLKFTKDSPEDIAVRLVAKNVGFALGQELPDVAQAILECSDKMLSVENFTTLDFHAWTDEVLDMLDIHDYYKMNFRELIKLVDIQVELVTDTEESAVVFYRGVIEAFVEGVGVGVGLGG